MSTNFNVYRREVGDTNPPVAIATGLTAKEHSDTTAVRGKSYLYSVGVVVNSVEKISDEISVLAYTPNIFRWILIRITANNGSTYTSIQEIELASEIGGSDITQPYPSNAYSQSDFYAPYGNNASKIIDNNLTDYVNSAWVSAGSAADHWVAIDLKVQREIAEVKIYPQNYADGLLRAPKNFKIQGSNDGVTFIDIAEYADVTNWVVGQPKVFNLITNSYT